MAQLALDVARVVLWWILVVVSTGLALYYRKSRSSAAGWTLFKLIYGTIVCQAFYISMWTVHNSAVRTVGLGKLTDTLYRICIPLNQLATSSFMGLLLLLAAGYCITRSDLGNYKAQVLGLPVLLFVTGVVTEYINFQVLEAASDQLELFELAGWEQGLWFVCTFLNLAALGFWVVYIFEIIQAEVDALQAQQELNLVRNAAPSSTVAPFPAPDNNSATHAAPPPGMDPDWAQAAAEDGVVAYKNLLGTGQNMSHIPGADVEAQEINTVADMVNFEMKRKMYKRFSTGFGVFIIAQLCVILAPVFVIDVVQDVITFFQFVVTWCFLAALLWLFRPVENSPYLLMGEGDNTLDTSLGVEDDEEDKDVAFARHSLQGNGYMSSNGVNSTSRRDKGSNGGVELMSAHGEGFAKGGYNSTGGARGVTSGQQQVRGDKDGRRDQVGGSSSSSPTGGQQQQHLEGAGSGLPVSSSARMLHPETPAAQGSNGNLASLVAEPPSSLPAIKTIIGSSRTNHQQQQQQQGAVATAKWSLGDDDDLQEVTLHGSERAQ